MGFAVEREYYINDAGRQMDILAVSTWIRYLELCGEQLPFPANGYRGDYIRDVAAAYLGGATVVADDREVTAVADADNPLAIREFAVAYLRREQEKVRYTCVVAVAVRFDK